MYMQSLEWDAKNILTMYSYIDFSRPLRLWGTYVVGVIGGWSPASNPNGGLNISFLIRAEVYREIKGFYEYSFNFITK